MTPVLSVAKNTFKEIIRDRILYALFFFAIFLVAFSYLLGLLSFAEQERIIINMGLMAIQVGCCLLAIFLGSSLVWREMEKQTILTLLSKPLTRSQFLVGKFLGLSAVLLLLNIMLSIIFYLICFGFQNFDTSKFLIAQGGLIFESFFLLSATIFFGVFCRPILASLFALSIWILGHGMNDLNYFSSKSKNELFKVFGENFSKYFINLERFNFREAVVYADPISSTYFFQSFLLCVAWIFVLMLLATRIFEKRDFT